MPKLTVICLTYNHKAFIRRALEGFVMQKTDFPFEVIVHDDASTDGTADVIREYENKYPHIIKAIYQKENQWGKQNVSREIIYPKITSEYVALCEGDDYWTDPLKLQKQVDFLDARPDFSVCFHPVNVIWEDESQPSSVFPTSKMLHHKNIFDLHDLLKGNFIQTNSVVYRWRFHSDALDILPNNILPGDWFLHLLHAQIGKIGFLPDVMAVYRKHSGGIWYGAGRDPKWYCRTYLAQIRFYKEVEKRFNFRMENVFYSTIYTTYYASLFLKNKKIQNELSDQYDFLPRTVEDNPCRRLLFVVQKLKKTLHPTTRNKTYYKALKLYFMWCKNYNR